jgi:hypothetical protein
MRSFERLERRVRIFFSARSPALYADSALSAKTGTAKAKVNIVYKANRDPIISPHPQWRTED